MNAAPPRSMRHTLPRSHAPLRLLLALLAIVLLLRPASAASVWTGTGGTNWATPSSWSPSGGPSTFDTASFTDTGSTSLLGDLTSLLNADRTIGGLAFNNTANHYHTLDLGSHTLTINGNLNFNTDQSGLTTTTLRDGFLLVNSAFASLNVGRSASSNAASIVDLSGLTSLNATLQSMQIGASSSGTAKGTLTLSPSNTISTQLLYVGASSNSSDTSGTLHLGAVNTILTPEFDLAKDNSNATVDIVSGGSLTLGSAGQQTLLQIANQNFNNQYNSYTGQLLLGKAAVNFNLSSLIVGQKNGGAGGTVGVLQGGGSGSVTIGTLPSRGNIYVGYSINGGSAQGSADFSGLDTLQAYVNDLFVGNAPIGSATGTLALPAASTIDAASSIVVGNNGGGTLTLGRTSNSLLTSQWIIGKDNSNGLVQIASGSSLTLGSAAQRTSLTIGSGNFNNSYVGYVSKLDLSGAAFNGYLNQLIVGQKDGGLGSSTGTLLGGNSGSINIGPSGNTANFLVGNSINGGGTAIGIVDFSGLASLTANLNTLSVGVALSGSAQGTLSLAASNILNANSIVVGNSGGNSNSLTLGRTSNSLLAGQLIIGKDTANGLVQIPSGSSLTLGAADQRTSVSIGVGNFNNGYVGYSGKLDLTGSAFNGFLSQLIVGQKDGGSGTTTGTLLGGSSGSINIGAAGNTANFLVGNTISGGSSAGTVDFSGLGTLAANLNTLAVGTATTGSAQGTLKLAVANTINANHIVIGDTVSGPNTVTNTLLLGMTNTFLVNQWSIGQDYTNGLVQIPGGGALTLGSVAQRTTLLIGTANTNDPYNTYSGTLDLSNATFVARLASVTIGTKNALPGSENGTLIISTLPGNYIDADSVVLGGTNSTGTLTFGGGVFFAGSITAGAGTATFNWTGGQLSVTAFGSPTRLFNLSNAGTGTLAPGTADGAAGTTTVYGNYTQGASAAAAIRIAGSAPGTGNDQLAVTGSATFAGTLKLSLLNSFTPALGQNFLIATYASHAGTFAFVAPPALSQDVAFQLDDTSGPTQLMVHMVAPTAQTWTSSAPAALFSTAGNWNTATAPTTTSAATILNATASAQTISLAAATTVHSITLSGSTAPVSLEVPQGIRLGVAYQIYLGANASLIGGGQIFGQVVNAGGAIIPASSASLQISGNILNSGQVSLTSGSTLDVLGNFIQSGSGVTSGPGSLLANAYVINGGTFQIGAGATTGRLGAGPITNNGSLIFNRSNTLSLPNAVTGTGSLTQAGTGTTTLSNYAGTGPLNLTAGTLAFSPTAGIRQTSAVLLQTTAASVAAGTTLDLTNHDLLIHGGNAATVESLIGSSYFFGLWNKPGITSSSAQSNPITTLGIMSGADYNLYNPTPGLFDGTPVANTDIVVKYTFSGDINLDGLVNDDDFGLFSGAYFFTGTGNYAAGDLNFDGLVNDDDFGVFSGNYFFTPAAPLATITPSPVPEPASLFLLTLGGAVMLVRPSRRINPSGSRNLQPRGGFVNRQ